MIQKFVEECKKINDLSRREATEFLLSNNCGMDEEIYNCLKQMILSQVHFDENIQLLITYYTGSDIHDMLLLTEDGIVREMSEIESSKRNYHDTEIFFEIMKELKNTNFEKINDLLSFILENNDPNFSFSEEDLKYFEQHGNGDKSEGYSKLEKEVKKFCDNLCLVLSNWDDIQKNELQKEKITKELEETQTKIVELQKILNGDKKNLLSRIQERIFEREKQKSLKEEKKVQEAKIKIKNEELNKLETNHMQLLDNYKKPEVVKRELLEKLDICEHLSTNKLNKRKIKELRNILIKGKNIEKSIELSIPRIYTIINDDGNYPAFTHWCEKLFADIQSQLKMNIGMFSEKNLKSEDLLTLINNIRMQMVKNRITSDHNITTNYRTQSLGESEYIKGTNLNNEQITEAMNQLNEDFKKMKSTNDIEAYIRGCADIFQKFLMIHPFMDGNGRTARTMLTVMLAQRNIFIPNIYDSYIERDSNSMFMIFGDEAAIKGNFRLFEDYLLARVQKYNPKIINGDYSYLEQIYQKILIEKYSSPIQDETIERKMKR